ncbi:Calvin cycle protein CP12 [Oscillatoria sp. HE19RPO]|uniref:Calvin cycle protein CP12 n=1 Tax=Oscillatoria sp. HE19RPO TaxID=2954806 RepID=UPI0020C59B63|nr:Calvin cycle protein CP12 [Oscillatoria sp. HE19RPO]
MAQVLTRTQRLANTRNYGANSQENQGHSIPLSLRIDMARDEARAIAAEKGIESPESAVAWDIVEELLSIAAHRRTQEPKSAFERYCLEHPGASEARIYDV